MQLGTVSGIALAAVALAAGASGTETARDLNNRAVEAYRAGRLADAESYYRRALHEWQAAGDRTGEAATAGNLAVLCRTAGRNSEAAALFGRALAAAEAAGIGETRQAATLLVNIAGFERSLGRTAQAEEAARRAAAILERQSGAAETLASARNELAAVLLEKGKPEDALRLLESSRMSIAAEFGESDPRLAPLHNNLAVAALGLKQYREAEEASRAALALWETALGPQHAKVAAALTNLGQAVRFQGRFSEAEAAYLRAIAILERSPGGAALDLARALANLADLQRSRDRFPECVALYRRALTILETTAGTNHPECALILERLAEVRLAQGHFAESARLYRRSLPLLLSAYGPSDPRFAGAQAAYKRLLEDPRALVLAPR